MNSRDNRVLWGASVTLGGLTLACVAVLLAWNIIPKLFSLRDHNVLAAVALTAIAVAHLLYQGARRRSLEEWVRAGLLAAAFGFWADNQFWPESRWAVLLNDLAIALFVADVFLGMIGWPAISKDAGGSGVGGVSKRE